MRWRSGEVLPDASSDLLEHLARAARDASVWRPTQRSRSTRTPANGRTSDHCARRARATTEPAAAAAPFAKTQSARPWQLRVARRPCSRETDRCGHQIGPSCSCSTTAACAGNLCMRLLRAVWASLPACSPSAAHIPPARQIRTQHHRRAVRTASTMHRTGADGCVGSLGDSRLVLLASHLQSLRSLFDRRRRRCAWSAPVFVPSPSVATPARWHAKSCWRRDIPSSSVRCSATPPSNRNVLYRSRIRTQNPPQRTRQGCAHL